MLGVDNMNPMDLAWIVLKASSVESTIVRTLKDEGGAAGLDALMKPLSISEDELKAKLKDMANVTQHRNGDYILTDGLHKHASSPEALRHKVEYDKKYESNPERVKYRESLNQERRKRGIYGQGGPDMSHTKEGTMVAEDPHANRARHFKERGTLK